MLFLANNTSALCIELRRLGIRDTSSARQFAAMHTHCRLLCSRPSPDKLDERYALTVMQRKMAATFGYNDQFPLYSTYLVQKRGIRVKPDEGVVRSDVDYNANVWLFFSGNFAETRVGDDGTIYVISRSDPRVRAKTSERCITWIRGDAADPFSAGVAWFSPEHWSRLRSWAHREYTYIDDHDYKKQKPYQDRRPLQLGVYTRELLFLRHLLQPRVQYTWQQMLQYASVHLPHWHRMMHLDTTSRVPMTGFGNDESHFVQLYRMTTMNTPQFGPVRSSLSCDSDDDYTDDYTLRVRGDYPRRPYGRMPLSRLAAAGRRVNSALDAAGRTFHEFYADQVFTADDFRRSYFRRILPPLEISNDELDRESFGPRNPPPAAATT